MEHHEEPENLAAHVLTDPVLCSSNVKSTCLVPLLLELWSLFRRFVDASVADLLDLFVCVRRLFCRHVCVCLQGLHVLVLLHNACPSLSGSAEEWFYQRWL